jgi:hypothetical protein
MRNTISRLSTIWKLGTGHIYIYIFNGLYPIKEIIKDVLMWQWGLKFNDKKMTPEGTHQGSISLEA